MRYLAPLTVLLHDVLGLVRVSRYRGYSSSVLQIMHQSFSALIHVRTSGDEITANVIILALSSTGTSLIEELELQARRGRAFKANFIVRELVRAVLLLDCKCCFCFSMSMFCFLATYICLGYLK